MVDKVVLFNLMNLARDGAASEQSRAIASQKIEDLQGWIKRSATSEREENQKAHLAYSSRQIDQFFEAVNIPRVEAPLGPPDGSPIGMDHIILEELCSWN